MISQHCLTFRSQFIELSERMFGNEENRERVRVENSKANDSGSMVSSSPFHPGEFGSHRELVATMFLRPFTADRFELASGFILGAEDDSPGGDFSITNNPAQCDILVIERNFAPFCRHRELGQFYPLEATSAVGEIKSQLTEAKLNQVLFQISKQTTEIRKRASRFSSRGVGWCSQSGSWPDSGDGLSVARNDRSGATLVFLICRSFAVDAESGTLPLWKKVRHVISKFETESESFTIPDAILSVTDGLLIRHSDPMGNRYECTSPGNGSTTHLKRFLSLYYSHMAHWRAQQFSLEMYFQVSDQDIVFEDGEISR